MDIILSDVVYGDGKFVAVGDFDIVLISTNGMTWKKQTAGIKEYLYGIAYGNGKFVATGIYYNNDDDDDNGICIILTSTDGTTWKEETIGIEPNPDINSVTYLNGLFITAGASGTVLSSADGMIWKKQIPSGITAYLWDVIYDNGRFVAVGDIGSIMTSRDGKTWKEQSSGTDEDLFRITYGGGKFVAVGNAGTILTSKDSVTWQKKNIGIEAYFNGITYGNGKFVAVGSIADDDAVILSSSDGTVWTEQTSVANAELYAITYGGKFVAVGATADYDAVLLTSADGMNWEEQALGIESELCGAAYGNGKFVVLGAGESSSILTSNDGVTWKQQPIDAYFIDYASNITYINSSFVAVSTPYIIFTSSDGATWKENTVYQYNDILKITYGNGFYVAVGANGTILTSAGASNNQSAPIAATPTSSKVLIDGKEVSFDAYNINGSNYFKIRDIAAAINGTGKQFAVGYDDEKKAIKITSKTPYAAAGGEGSKGDGLVKSAVKSTETISCDGSSISWECYKINGYNYIKLRDIGKTMDFGVLWNARLETIEINTGLDYTE